MTHLTPQQFVDAVDGTLSAVHPDHLSACRACREELASLRALAGEVEALEASEPSPLFWEHFSRRVHAATSTEPLPSSSGWWKTVWNPMITIALAAATMAIVLSVRSMPRPSDAVEPLSAVTPVAEDAMASDTSQDDPLTFVARIASALPQGDLQQTAAPTRDVANAALDDLNADQRAELVRLIKAKIGSGE